jgi:UDP-3-O-[3-hydroxymyristoyl] glucosamine N-acyltransferase
LADKRFFTNHGPFSLADLAKQVGGEFLNEATKELATRIKVVDVQTLNRAMPDDITFFHNPKYRADLNTTAAGCIITTREMAAFVPEKSVVLVHPTPYRAYANIARLFYPEVDKPAPCQDKHIATTARIAPSAILEPGVVIKDHVSIGAGTVIGANTVIETGVEIGEQCAIGSNITLSHCILGKQVTILPGTRIGQAGFGFVMDAKGYVNVPQLGCVLIEDQVEIGANVTIDRGTLEDTVIGAETRIDNLVQIGHGVQVGRQCVLVAQVGIAGSTRLGNFVVAAGQVGLAGHLKIGDGVKIAAQSGVMRDVEPKETIAGTPAVPVRQWHRQTVSLAQLAKSKVKKKEI